MNSIETLTESQQKRLVEYRDEWLAIGRSTEKANRPQAEAAIARMYEFLGRPRNYFWWCDGPAVGSIVRSVLREKRKGANLEANLGANLEANFGANLEANLLANLGANLRANSGDNLLDRLLTSILVFLSERLRRFLIRWRATQRRSKAGL